MAQARRHSQGAALRHAWLVRALTLLALVATVLVARHFLLADNAHPTSRAQRVRLVGAPHPPPPRPKEEKPKEPEKPKEADSAKVPENYQGQLTLMETPTPGPPGPPGPPGEKPLDDQLGVEAEGEGAGDSFGLVAKRGGHDITRLGSGGGGGGIDRAQQQMLFRGYGQTVAQRLAKDLQDEPTVLTREYVVVTLVWIDTHGRIVRSELPRASGSPEIDAALRRALAGASILPEPPSGLPQPLKLRFTVKQIEEKEPGG